MLHLLWSVTSIVDVCITILFKFIYDNDGRYFFMNPPVLPKNKENEHLIKITNIVNTFKANVLKPNES